VQCFGRNEAGQLGTGDARPSDVPVAVYGVSNARRVGVSEQRSCVLDAAGSVHCWGNRGVDTQEIERSAVPVASPAPLESFVLGRLSLCGLDASRRVLCSGSNFRDRIGLGNQVDNRRELTHVEALGLADEVAVSVHYTCARSGDTLRCVGEVPSTAREELTPFVSAPSDTPAAAVSAPPAAQTRCVADEDCLVAPRHGCCEPCSGFRVEELVAVHRNAAGAQRRAACPELMRCPECVTPPPPAEAKCVQDGCVLVPLRSGTGSP
jgi:hypothetical protein